YRPRQLVEKGERKRCLYASRVSCPTVPACETRGSSERSEEERWRKRASWTLEGEQGGANEWTTGLTAAECTAGSPAILRFVSSHLQIRC
ncbi:hypothetical protein DBV15_01656, partial [Temnothorax longispinosus]